MDYAVDTINLPNNPDDSTSDGKQPLEGTHEQASYMTNKVMESKKFILDLPRFARDEGTCRINGKHIEYRLCEGRIEFRIGTTDAWESRLILDERTVSDTVLYVCNGEPPDYRTSPQAIEKPEYERYLGRVVKAQDVWELYQEADGYGLIVTDDYLLAQFLADHFGVQPTELYPDYLDQFDLDNLHDGPEQESD